MRRAWSWLGLNLGKHAGLVSVIGLAVTVILGLGITQLKFQTDQSSFLNKTDPAYVQNEAYQNDFGGDSLVTMFTMAPGTDVSGLGTPADEAQMVQLAARLHTVTGVNAVVTPLTALGFANTLTEGPGGNVTSSIAGKVTLAALAQAPTPAARALRSADAEKTLARAAAIPLKDRTLTDPAWVRFLLFDNTGAVRAALRPFFPNTTHAQMLVRFVGHQDIDQESATAAQALAIIEGTHFDNATTVTVGAPLLLKTLNDYLKGGILILGGIAAVVMLLILVLLFDVRWRLLPLGIVAIGVIWAFGLAGYVGIPLTLATITGLPIMLGIGIDYAIQMHSRVEEEVLLDRAAHPIQASARNLGPALLVVTFDAIFAFLALEFAHVPMIREFGTLLAIGVAMICLCSIIGPLAVLGIREYKSPTDPSSRRDFSKGRLSRLVVWLGSLSVKVAVPFAVVAVVVFLAGIAVEGKLTIQTDPVTWINQHSQLITDIHQVEAGVGSANELDAYVRSPDMFSDQSVAYVFNFENTLLAKNPGLVNPGTGVVSTTSNLAAVDGTPAYLPTGALVKAVWAAAPPDIQRITVNPSATSMNIIFPALTTSLDDLHPTVTDIEHYPSAAGTSVVPAGIASVGVGLLQNIESNRTLLTYLAVLFVFLFLSLRLRSVIRALLSLVPVLVAVGLTSLVAYAIDLKLSPATAVSGPLVVAVCTEFTSLILLRFVEERSRGYDPRQAMDVTASRTGRAFAVSALTAVAGIAVIASSSLPLLRGFGLQVAFNVTIALLCALVVLPPILVWADGFGWVSRGLLRTDVDARVTAGAGALATAGVGAGSSHNGAPDPGWYPENGSPTTQRYWNGRSWGPRIMWDGTEWVTVD